MLLVNGVAQDAVSARDRGLAYGDGVFRTLRLRAGKPLFWERHYRKLAHDCAAIGIACPESSLLQGELRAAANDDPDGVARITVTRGSGERGYAPPTKPVPTRVVGVAPAPERPPHWATEGVLVRLCAMRATFQPRLAGIKHLNRLDSVLARAEWTDPGIAEGLLLDHRGDVVSGTMGNVFAVERGVLVTPDLAGGGVAGVQRERVLEYAAQDGSPVRTEPLSLARLLAADEVFLVNSVIGLWPVIAIADRRWQRGALTARVAAWLRDKD
jgi:4-amino-4-deoxychorismate lyase